MAKKVSVTSDPTPKGAVAAETGDEIHPVTPESKLPAPFVVKDANDGSHDGKQPSFSMPKFANGPDVRHRG